MTEVAISGF